MRFAANAIKISLEKEEENGWVASLIPFFLPAVLFCLTLYTLILVNDNASLKEKVSALESKNISLNEQRIEAENKFIHSTCLPILN